MTVHILLSVFTNSARMNWWGFSKLATDLLKEGVGGGGGGAPGPQPPVLFDFLIIIAAYHFSFLSSLFSPKLVVDFFLLSSSLFDTEVSNIWD